MSRSCLGDLQGSDGILSQHCSSTLDCAGVQRSFMCNQGHLPGSHTKSHIVESKPASVM